jgi:pseudouridine-5'-phosphate glycosidase
MNMPNSTTFDIHPDVQAALAGGSPVVALESALITHGLPWPHNLETARTLERIVRAHGATPATIAVLDGRIKVGLTGDELSRLAAEPLPRPLPDTGRGDVSPFPTREGGQGVRSASLMKVSLRDLAIAASRGADGGTTVAATAWIAHRVGIQVFATGGIGGVHRGQPFDVSADLPVLAQTPVAVVCAGAKAILDLPLTLEWLETHGVPVLGYQTDEFPAFYSRSSGLPVDLRVDSPGEAVAVMRAHWALGLTGGVLVVVPPPTEVALPRDTVEAAINQALAEAELQGIRGRDVTPFLLARVAELTSGESLAANVALLENNAAVAARIATCDWRETGV